MTDRMTQQEAIENAVDSLQEFVEVYNDRWVGEAQELWKERLSTSQAGIVSHTTTESRFAALVQKTRTYRFLLDNPRIAATLFELLLVYDTPRMRGTIPNVNLQLHGHGVEGLLVFDRSKGQLMTYLQGQWVEVQGQPAPRAPYLQDGTYQASEPVFVGTMPPTRPIPISNIPSVFSLTAKPQPTALRIQWVTRGGFGDFRCYLPVPLWDVLSVWPRFERVHLQRIEFSALSETEATQYLRMGMLYGNSISDSGEFIRLENGVNGLVRSFKVKDRYELGAILSADDISTLHGSETQSWIASALSLMTYNLRTTAREATLGNALTQAVLDSGQIRVENILSIRRWSRQEFTIGDVLEAIILLWKAVHVTREIHECPYEPVLAMLRLPEIRERCMGLDLADPDFVTLYIAEDP